MYKRQRLGIGNKITEARALVAKKNYTAATALLEHAHEVSQDNLHVARALAHIHYKAGKLKEAAKYFDLYSEENPGDTQAIELLGTILLKLGETEKAADVLTRLKIRNPRDEKIAAQLAKIYK